MPPSEIFFPHGPRGWSAEEKMHVTLPFVIDDFRVGHQRAQCIYLLTHCHSDHLRIPRTFAYRVHTSRMSHALLPSPPSQLYGTFDRVPGWYFNNQLYVFDSHHMYGSIGFYCHPQRHVHWGDGRPNPGAVAQLRKALDTRGAWPPHSWALDQHVPKSIRELPTIYESRALLAGLLQRYPDSEVIVPCLGTLLVLFRAPFPFYPILPSESKWAEVVDLVRSDKHQRHGVHVRRRARGARDVQYSDKLRILVGLRWWLVAGAPPDSFVRYDPDKRCMEMLLSLHASESERALCYTTTNV